MHLAGDERNTVALRYVTDGVDRTRLSNKHITLKLVVIVDEVVVWKMRVWLRERV